MVAYSYLYRRDGKESSPINVISGVPYGSVLGPLLFSIYINDITHTSIRGNEAMSYADDILLYKDIVANCDVLDLQNDTLLQYPMT